jgi:hypothetical protein
MADNDHNQNIGDEGHTVGDPQPGQTPPDEVTPQATSGHKIADEAPMQGEEAAQERARSGSTGQQKTNRLYWVIGVVIVLACIALTVLYSLISRDTAAEQPVEPTAIVPAEPTEVVEEESAQAEVEPTATVPPIAPVLYPPEQFFILNELIVSGPRNDVEKATNALIDQNILSEPTRLNVSDLLVELPGGRCPGLFESLDQDPGQERVIDRYVIEDENRNVFSLIDDIQSDSDTVTAEPNRIIGSPWEVEGSPWEVEGSPWEVEGSGQTGPSNADSGTSTQQWAFGKHGIELPRLVTNTWPTGEGILVGVFDTLPFATEANQATDFEIDWVETDWMSDSLTLTITALSLEEDPDELASGGGLGSATINHGLYVAGLIHALAPRTEIQLIRVLDKNNVGDMFALLESLHNFLQPSNRSGYDGAVINMSLGIRIPPLEARNLAGLPKEVLSLQDLLAVARCLNVVVVAASGNNSARSTVPELPNLPAAWSSVIGVGASNINKGLSCFSNQGDISAPGGDGRETDGPAEICRPRNNECLDAECPFGVIGPISKTLSTDSGYAYWTGSSFAAPMVSGLAAEVLDIANGSLTPTEVRAILECGATPSNDRYLGAGVINVQRTLSECWPQPQ